MIGIDVEEPKETCNDPHCPFHGHLKVRGIIIKGRVVSADAQQTVVVERERLHYVPKYERYEKRTGRYPAHLPSCITVEKGDEVIIMECRPLSKTKHFVVVAKQ
ncbi:MAG TPA: 30S ribosomal protein S17 [Thermoplasmatales archaeon]|nr:MAG: 30S ribosomal protein S17 [Thermoplasmata archaeon]RLF32195.1 MAG: 30S ribosomal protein S17 [Thermoplasmata archaeon]HDN50794.1 30S ribosomal protein S17 [Thermoplasmatales archaeon]